ncbi:BTAD domain-containing putative transcriptional regulator [Streptomyces sp. NPDC058867]|uniref:AfsR/SARP family transcriptional regulator n=1 Tax=unclassified Streptomyces TaxID=2593676 RepID=UPI00368EDB9C
MEETETRPLRFALLGPLRAWRGDRELALGSPQQRAVLAMLLLRRGNAVTSADLVDGVWPVPPARAVAMLRTYASRLRKLLEPEREKGQPFGVLVSAGDGYALRTDLLSSDLDACARAVTRAERHRDSGEADLALRALSAALADWSSPALLGVPGPFAEAARADLAERRLGAVEFRIRMELEVGRHEAVVPELQALRDGHPLRESVSELLIVALDRCGRRAEAVEVYTRTRHTLVEELGLEPGPSLRALHSRLLDPSAGTPDDTARRPGPNTAAPPDRDRAVKVRPSQLPPDLATFTGRDAELDGVAALLTDGGGSTVPPAPGTCAIGVIDGMAGVGKTTLAVRWAHQVADRFPDGQLYVNLRGYDPSGSLTDPGEAVSTFLVALGVAPQAVPEGLDAQTALYRTLLADRRVLIVLDNARDTEQVRPLLPGSSGCLVIVTSRSRLTSLVARHGARPFALGLLSEGEARELLVRRLGGARVAAEPEAVAAISGRCAGLPLALAIVAARAALHPGFRLADIAQELRAGQGGLDAFARGQDIGSDARAVFSWSYQALSPGAAALFRRLAVHPGPDISAVVAAALAGVDRRRVRGLLAELCGASLLIQHAPGRYVFHDLLRAYAHELVTHEDGAAEREAVALRMYDHYLHTAHHASAVLAPFRETITLAEGTTDCEPLRFNDSKQAMEWLRSERLVLRSVVEHATAHGRHDHAWRTAYALDLHFDRLGYWHDLMEISGAALRASRALGDPVGQAHALRSLGFGHTRFNHEEEALRHLGRALELFRREGDAFGEARTRRALAYQANRSKRHDTSLDHYAHAGALYRSLGHRSGEAGVMNEIGWTYILLGDHQQALEHCEKAVSLQQEAGDLNGEASAQDSVGYAHHHLGAYGAAVARFERAVELYRQLGSSYLEADTLRHLAESQHAAGATEAAREAWEAALVLLESGGHAEADEVRRDLDGLDR